MSRERHRRIITEWLPNIDIPTPFPQQEVEIKFQANRVSERLIDNPATLLDFARTISDHCFLYQTSQNTEAQQRVLSYLDQIMSVLDNYQWDRQKLKRLQPPQTAAILSYLPDLDSAEETQEDYRQKIEHIAEKLTDGFLNRRFESTYDWRGAVFSWGSFLEGAVLREEIGLLNRVYDLALGKYPNIFDINSQAGRSIYLSDKAADPKDEKVLETSFMVSSSLSIIAIIIGKTGEYFQHNQEDYSALAIKFDCCRDLLLGGFDPRSKTGRRRYEEMVRNMSPSLKRFYGSELNYEQIASEPLTPDIIEVALTLAKNPKRAQNLVNFLIEGNKIRIKDGYITDRVDDKYDEVGKHLFPYDVAARNNWVEDKLIKMVNAGRVRQDLLQLANNIAQQSGRNLLPFSQKGVYGYIIGEPGIVSSDSLTTWQKAVKLAEQLIIKYEDTEQWQATLIDLEANNRAISKTIEFPGVTVILSKSDYSSKTDLETLLDHQIPENLRLNALEVFRELVRLRFQIPRNFTQMPTLGGNLYLLDNYPNLFGVFKEVLINKRAEGGLYFRISLLPIPKILGGLNELQLQGGVEFSQNRAEVKFESGVDRLPLDLQWILEKVVLRLTEDSCCLPISERDELSTIGLVPEENETKHELAISIPGRVVHVGGYRRSGERRQFSQQAETYFRKAMSDIGIDTGGISLALINEEHRKKVPGCNRYLTWNRGYEPTDTPPPILRTTPMDLI
jgi:hypothetical protein